VNVSPANAATPATGKPTLSAQYTKGAGGAGIKSYRFQVTGAGVAYDSGLLYDGKLALTPPFAPLIPSGTVCTLTITVASTDDPIGGSSAGVVSTTTFTPTYAAPPVPTGPTATADSANGKVTVGWTNPAGSAVTNRVYYRISGSSTWILLKDAIHRGDRGSDHRPDGPACLPHRL